MVLSHMGMWGVGYRHGVHLADLTARRLLLLPANQPRCHIPQQPYSLLVAGEELGAESIKDDYQIAPAQATPHSPQCPARAG